MINYPNGNKPFTPPKTPTRIHTKSLSANRGMGFEQAVNRSNEFYVEQKRAIITKRPTPIKVVEVDYSAKGARITNAFFEKQSTADYNGVYRGKYLDFEAKSTQSKTSLPLANITQHQVDHLSAVIAHGGIAFFLIEFATRQEIYLVDAKIVLDCYQNGQKRSLSYANVKEKGHRVNELFAPAVDYLAVVDQVYFG